MPLPWKKSNVSRFQRIVQDLQDLQSPNKRGNSLVVETGFPTSLVDLFVKNKDRLKKPPSKKKKKKHQHQHQEVVEELVISDPIPFSSFKDPSSDHVCADNKIDRRVVNLDLPRERLDGFQLVSKLPVKENVVVLADDDDGNKCWTKNEKRVLLVVLKIFVVVVLGLSTKRLAVGLTMSAFVLILLEYAGKHILCFLKPCSNARLVLDPFVQRIYSFILGFKRLKNREDSRNKGLVIGEEGDAEDHQADDVSGIDSCDLVETFEFDYPVDEIQSVESSVELGEENRRKLGIVEVDKDRNGGLVCEKEGSQSGKTKKKFMKKLVPKKLRKKKKGKDIKEMESDMSSEASSCCWVEDNNNKLGKSEVIDEQQQEEDDNRKDSKNKGKKVEKEEEVLDRSVSSSSTSSKIRTEVEEVHERRGNSFYLIILLVVLAGLVGGRVLALLLTLISCLMLKLVGRCRSRVKKGLSRSSAFVSKRIPG